LGVEAEEALATARQVYEAITVRLPNEQRLQRIARLGFRRHEFRFLDRRFDGVRAMAGNIVASIRENLRYIGHFHVAGVSVGLEYWPP
jgi:hydroxypyruvate isomerase